jgi:hypothetical protein
VFVGVTIERYTYAAQAQRAADLTYTLLGAVEDCGADPELTNIVVELRAIHQRIRRLFDLVQDPAERAAFEAWKKRKPVEWTEHDDGRGGTWSVPHA